MSEPFLPFAMPDIGEEEIAEVMKLSLRTVQRDWNLARAWLYNELSNS